MEHIFIRDFDTQAQAAPNGSGGIFISFAVSADDAGEFNYELHAVFTAPDNSITEEILLAMGYGMLNEELVLDINTKDMQEMGGFMLRLTEYVRYGQASIRDTAWLDLRTR
jgi:hypothetical protein